MLKKILKLVEYIIYGILGLLLIINTIIMIKTQLHPKEIPGIFGRKPFVVLSGSMKPNILIGDLIIVKEVDANTLQKDDIIAYRDDKDLVTTHRIINVIKTDEDICFETKGDSNNVKDSALVCSKDIEGKYIHRIARLGNLILFVQQPLGFGIMMITILLIGVIIFMISNRKIDKEFAVETEEERKAFEEFKRMREEQKNNDEK